MTNLSVSTIGAMPITIPPEDLQALRAALRGSACAPTDAGYDEARTIWNAMIDRRPGLAIRCQGAADVMLAVDLARKHELLVAVRGGGHNIAGSAVCDGGLLIDLSPMRWVRVDPVAKRVNVGPGATLADVDREAQAFGLALPTGINSTTGIGGLTLGGGFGWLTRKFGMTIDNLISAEMVTADGQARAGGREGQPRPVLGDSRRRRQFRDRHEFRVPASCRRSAGAVRAGRASFRRRQGDSHAVSVHPVGSVSTTSPAGPSCARRRRCRSCPRNGTAVRF